MSKITYENKVALNENPSIADINKVKDTDMNEIKEIVNGNDNQVVIDTTEPEDLDNLRIWVNTDEPLQNVGTEVVNSLDGNETNMAPSVNAIKEANKYSTEEIKTDETYDDGKPIYKKTIKFNVTGTNTFTNVPHNVLNMDNFVDLKIHYIYSNSYWSVPNDALVEAGFNKTNITYYNTNSYIVGAEAEATIKYTKTID